MDDVLFINIPLKVKEEEIIKLKINEGGGGGGILPYYDGSYVVTPKLSEQNLNTKQKSMSDNLKVKKISFVETSNLQGGYTLTIGDI